MCKQKKDYKNLGLDVGVVWRQKRIKHNSFAHGRASSIRKEKKAGEAEGFDVFLDIVCVMVDEVHKAKADVLKD